MPAPLRGMANSDEGWSVSAPHRPSPGEPPSFPWGSLPGPGPVSGGDSTNGESRQPSLPLRISGDLAGGGDFGGMVNPNSGLHGLERPDSGPDLRYLWAEFASRVG
jgi:hypothetical protein